MPPQWTPLAPYFALPVLAGEIIQAGHTCKIQDLNVAFFHHLLSPEYLSWCRIGAENRRQSLQLDFIQQVAELGPDAVNKSNHVSSLFLQLEEKINRTELHWDGTIHNIAAAKQVLQSEEHFYDPNALQWAFDTLYKGLEIASLPYFPSQILLSDFRNPTIPMTLDAMIQAVDNEHENPFKSFYQMALPAIEAEQPRIVGITINASSQLLAGLTLAQMVKTALPQTHVVLGGNLFTRIADTLTQKPELFEQFCDSLIVREGEIPFVALIEEIKGEGDLSQVPNLMTRHADGSVRLNPIGCSKPLNQLAPPNLDGMDLSVYLSPEIVLPMQASRGCYWKKCTFCDHDFGVNYNLKTPEKVVADLQSLVEKYGIRHFEFIDESISPPYLKKMSEAILQAGLEIRFFIYARTEAGFSQEILNLAHRAGCRMVMWGIETGNPRIFELIDKGIPWQNRLEPLYRADAAGLWNFCFIFFGFPTETPDEAMDTIHLMMDHKDVIHSYGLSHFTLGKQTRMRRSPEAFGLMNIREDQEELSTRLHYEVREGMTPEQTLQISQLCTTLCNLVHRDPLWFSIGFREFLHLYLCRFGQAAIKRFSYHDASAPLIT
jgi:anaerobic magnesium-protoporphyrin IX monomethyl ester cyclase